MNQIESSLSEYILKLLGTGSSLFFALYPFWNENVYNGYPIPEPPYYLSLGES